jgi:hypothetical protein
MGPLTAGDIAVQLVDANETLCISTEAAFLQALGCIRDGKNARVKVLSVFGPTGEGKSHALNQLLFGGREVFKTSSSVGEPCTGGVYAAYEPNLGILALDTEGIPRFYSHYYHVWTYNPRFSSPDAERDAGHLAGDLLHAPAVESPRTLRHGHLCGAFQPLEQRHD